MKISLKKIKLATWQAALLLAATIYWEGCSPAGHIDEQATKRWSAQTPRSGHSSTPWVELRKTGNRYQLFRYGEPYFIKGACGHTELALIREAGGNSIRTYTPYGLDTLLDQAHAHGLTVMVGLWVGREREGFDYEDRAAVIRQRKELLETVNRHKTHPAVLCWALGNEPAHLSNNTAHLWRELDSLAALIQLADPNHPVTTVGEYRYMEDILDLCPNIDFLSINTAGNLPAVVDWTTKANVPYLIAELTCFGPWEQPYTQWSAAFEESLAHKCQVIKNNYERYILPDSLYCLGSYVFYWGQKQEYTPTWFCFFLEDGARTPLVDLMFELWGGTSLPNNRAPFLDSMLIDGKREKVDLFLQSGALLTASVKAQDPEGDELLYHWEILPEGPFYKFSFEPGKGWHEVRPQPLPGLIQERGGSQIRFTVPPKNGAYRLFVYATDGHGNGASANLPFFVLNNNLATSSTTQKR